MEIERQSELVCFVLEASSGLPMPRRTRVLRALAFQLTLKADRVALLNHCDALESADRRLREFAFNFTLGKERP
jgi:hypothetical protein